MENNNKKFIKNKVYNPEKFSIFDLKDKVNTTVIIFDQLQLDYILDRLISAIKFGKYEF